MQIHSRKASGLDGLAWLNERTPDLIEAGDGSKESAGFEYTVLWLGGPFL